MVKTLSKAARKALAATDWRKVDAITDDDIARQIAANRDAAPDMAPAIDVRAIRRAAEDVGEPEGEDGQMSAYPCCNEHIARTYC
jgi:hypothetical protein